MTSATFVKRLNELMLALAGGPASRIWTPAFYRYPHYHGAGDTPEKLRYPEMAQVVAGLAQAVQVLATRPGHRRRPR